MTNEKAIQWLTMARDKPVRWDDYSDESKSIREAAEASMKCAYNMAIEALEAQKPRLLKAEELKSGMVVWLDDRSWESVQVDEIVEIQKHRTACAVFYDRTKERHEVYFHGTTWTNFIELYGVDWVAWTAKPNLEQRKSVKWRRSEEAAWCGVGYKGLTTAIEYL